MNDYYLRFIARGDKIAVAISGGRDSVALLHFLLNKSADGGFSVCAINVEHGIRGERSLRDSAFVKELCAAWNVPLYAYTADALSRMKREGTSLEQAARTERYDIFDRFLEEKKADKIATAHHLGDNAETVLENLLRGASLKGAAGIPPQRNAVIRPFLHTSREEITAYVEQNALPYVEDETNASSVMTRNFLRHEVMPKLKSKFPAGERAVMRFCEIAREEDNYLDREAEKLLTKSAGVWSIPVSAPRVLLRRATILIMKQCGIAADYESVHADSVCALVCRENGTRVSLPDRLVAIREYDRISFFFPKEEKFAERPFSEGTYRCGECILTIEASSLTEEPKMRQRGAFYVDADKLSGAVIRTREDGDMFRKFGGGRKKLKEYYIDRKIPRRLRDTLLLIARGKEILFSGTEISEDVRADETTTRAFRIICKTGGQTINAKEKEDASGFGKSFGQQGRD